MSVIPRWSCNHVWQPIAAPYSVWTSSGTLDAKPPKDCPTYQTHECALCGGHRDFPVLPNAKPVHSRRDWV